MFENSLYSAPVVEHKPPSHTFLLVRNRDHPDRFTVRACPTVFSVGQEQLFQEIYSPSARKRSTYAKDRVRLDYYYFFFRLFVWEFFFFFYFSYFYSFSLL